MPFTIQKIPIDGVLGKFRITLAGQPYVLKLQWADYGNGDGTEGQWILDIYDSDEAPIACGIGLCLGVDALGQHGYLGIGGGIVLKSFLGLENPNFYNFTTSYQLLFVVGSA